MLIDLLINKDNRYIEEINIYLQEGRDDLLSNIIEDILTKASKSFLFRLKNQKVLKILREVRL